MRRALLVLGIALALAVSGGIGIARDLGAPSPAAAPVAIADPFLNGSLSGADLADTIAAMQQHLQVLPQDDRTWAALGIAYVEQARLTGNASYYPKAAGAIARSQHIHPDDNEVALTAAAALAAARHHFGSALRLADAALEIDPYQPGALAIRVDALTELGRYGQQLSALQVADRRQPGVPVFARYSYAYELRGDTKRAAELLERSADSATTSADRAYLLTLLADLERRTGDLDAAERDLDLALRESPDYVAALASRARLAVARGRLGQAARLWEQVTDRLPLPEYLVEMGELYAQQGRNDEAAQQFSVVEATQQLLASNGVNTDLESAIYSADHGSPSQALDAARTEWNRRHSIHVADAYAWALHVNGDQQAALAMARKATRLGTPEARLWVHRGTIEAALGLDDAARTHLRRGLAIDPGYSPWQADRAATLLSSLGVDR